MSTPAANNTDFSLTETLGLGFLPENARATIDDKASNVVTSFALYFFQDEEGILRDLYDASSDEVMKATLTDRSRIERVWQYAINHIIGLFNEYMTDDENASIKDASAAVEDFNHLTALDYAKTAAEVRISAGQYVDDADGKLFALYDSGLDAEGNPIVENGKFIGTFGKIFAEYSGRNDLYEATLPAPSWVNGKNAKYASINHTRTEWQKHITQTTALVDSVVNNRTSAAAIKGDNLIVETLAGLQISPSGGSAPANRDDIKNMLKVLELDLQDGNLDGSFYKALAQVKEAMKKLPSNGTSNVSSVTVGGDADSDGVVDNVTFIISGVKVGGSALSV